MTIPDRDWEAWATDRQARVGGPQHGHSKLIRATRHPGTLVLRCVAPGRSVAAWRPDTRAMEVTLARFGRPRFLLGRAVALEFPVPGSGPPFVGQGWGLTFWGPQVQTATGRGAARQLVMTDPTVVGWLELERIWQGPAGLRSWRYR